MENMDHIQYFELLQDFRDGGFNIEPTDVTGVYRINNSRLLGVHYDTQNKCVIIFGPNKTLYCGFANIMREAVQQLTPDMSSDQITFEMSMISCNEAPMWAPCKGCSPHGCPLISIYKALGIDADDLPEPMAELKPEPGPEASEGPFGTMKDEIIKAIMSTVSPAELRMIINYLRRHHDDQG